jgi:hypothetical protein
MWYRTLVALLGSMLALPGVRPEIAASEPETGYPVFPGAFFPPTAPIYGAAIEDRPGNAARIIGGRRLHAPDGLADFVCDSFYPALGTRLYALDLGADLESRLHDYRAKRLVQVNALLNQFVTLHDSPADELEQRLRQFAETQTPALLALENEAERLRADLIADAIWNRINWNANRRWKVGDIKPGGDGFDAEAEYQVVRAAAFYQNGLTSQQRGLLRELATELQGVVRKARGLPAARAESDAMFFSPEMSRLRLPPDLPPELREKIAAYNARKAALKRELQETVIAQDGASAGARDRAFEALADRQWPHFGMLEEQAEEIRRLLGARFELSAPPAPPWIPAGILETIRAYNEDRDTYFGELRRRIETAERLVPKPDQNVALDERVQRQRDFTDRRAEARRHATLEFQKEHATRFATLEQRYRGIRQSLSLIAEKQTDRRTGRPLDADTLLRQHAASMEEFATFGRTAVIYTNYRTAMLQPGLSPPQRRLLFGYAQVGLAQPLPHGELMPRRNAKRPYPSW